jgi:hypothetical protein
MPPTRQATSSAGLGDSKREYATLLLRPSELGCVAQLLNTRALRLAGICLPAFHPIRRVVCHERESDSVPRNLILVALAYQDVDLYMRNE